MKRNIVKLSCLALTLIIALNSIMVLSAFAQARPRVYVDPALNEFSTDTTSVGATFPVAVKAADWVDLSVFSYQFTFLYNTTMLEATFAEIPDGHWLTPTIKPANLFVVDSGTIDTALGTVSFSATLLSPELGKTGAGTIATITLKIIAAPALGKSLTCSLGFEEVIMVNPDAAEIPKTDYDVVPATFTYASPPPPKPFLSVSSFGWDNTAADAAGRLFNITVSMNGLSADLHLVGIQFFLSFDKAIIDTKAEWINEGPFARQFGPPDEPTFFVAYVEQDIIVGELQLPPYPGPIGWMNGSGVIATIQFNATAREGESDLTLSNIQLVDADENEIEYGTPSNGHYTMTVAPPPWLSVSPKTAELASIGDSFDLNVAINGLVQDFKMVGAEFQVHYNTTVLETTDGDITEGEFMKDFATRAGTSTFFQAYVEDDYGLIGIIILPLPNGTWPLDVFPEGSGVLATLKFKAIYQLDNDDVITELTVSDVLLANIDAKEIPVDSEKTAAEGKCVCTILKAVVEVEIPPHPDYPYSIDLYTQYVSPYGGQGYNQASDAFPPQAEILMNAEATYFGDAVVGKPVVFTIHGPGGVQYSAVVSTNGQGVATLNYIVPWAVESFGLWHATASWQIGAKVITDMLYFRVGFLVRVDSISLTPIEVDKNGKPVTFTDPRYNQTYPVYYKGSTKDLSMSLTGITMQSPAACMSAMMGTTADAWVAIAIFDELGQPVAYNALHASSLVEPQIQYENTTEGRMEFVVQQKTQQYTVPSISVTIGPNAFSGRASVQANVLTAAVGGVTYCQPNVNYVWIWSKNRITGPTADSRVGWLEIGEKSGKYLDVVEVPVNVHDIDPAAHIVAIQFRVTFDTSLVELADLNKDGKIDENDVIERDFVKQFGTTFFAVQVDIQNGLIVGELQLPPYPGANGWMTGSGTMCSLFFKVLYKAPPPTGAVLTLSDAFLVNGFAEPIEFTRLDNGYISIVG